MAGCRNLQGQREELKEIWPRTPLTPRTADALDSDLAVSVASPYAPLRVYRYAGAYRVSFVGLRLSKRACSAEPSSLTGVRLDSLARVPIGLAFLTAKTYRPQSKPPDRGRAVGCGPSLLGQAAHCEGRPRRQGRRGTAKPWIRRRSLERVVTYDPASAFAELAGFAADNPTPDVDM